MDTNIIHFLYLHHHSPKISYDHIHVILNIYDTMNHAYEDDFSLITTTELQNKLRNVYASFSPIFGNDIVSICHKKQIQIIDFTHNDFPRVLQHMKPQPLVLYYQGDLSLITSSNIISMVGSRNPHQYALDVISSLLGDLQSYPIVTVSGLAYGVDAAVHVSSIIHAIPTIAVVGSGLSDDVLYPRTHILLKQRIINAGGLILSIFHPTERARPYFFPWRNSIIVLLAQIVLVLQAGIKSGSMVTLKYALEYGKTVYTIPARLSDSGFEGNLYALSNGCGILLGAQDIVHELLLELKGETNMKWGVSTGGSNGGSTVSKGVSNVYQELPDIQKYIVSILRKKPLTIDEIEHSIIHHYQGSTGVSTGGSNGGSTVSKGVSNTIHTHEGGAAYSVTEIIAEMELYGYIEGDGMVFKIV